ncbi:MAG: amidase [Balneola sp.]|jgi:amidase
MRITKSALLLLLAVFIACQPSQSKFEQLGLEEATIEELHENYKNGTYTAKDVVEAYLERIEQYDQNGPEINSVITINPDAIAIAEELDKQMAEGNTIGVLHGIPVLLKDNIDTKDKMANTAGSRVMEGSMPMQDAYIVQKLRESGAIILGKANLSEWANFHSNNSSSGWSGLGGQTKNPFDITRNPCGSSAGSGASVSANFAMLTIGTETNGSITCPSSANGVVGIKPTVGLLSRSGIIPISETQDTPGPMARTVTDAAIMLGTMVGVDSRDSYTNASEEKFHSDYTQFLKTGALDGKRLGLYKPSIGSDHKTDTLMYETIRFLEEQGVTIVEIDRIGNVSSRDGYNVLLYEFKDGINKYLESLGENSTVADLEEIIEKTLADPVEMKFDHDILLQAQKKGHLDTEEYIEARANMLKAAREDGIDKVMEEHDLDGFIGITGGPAWKTDHTNGDNFGTSSSSPAARAGYAAITVPMGFIDGLPVGITFFGGAWMEPEMIEMAYSFEQLTNVRKAPEFRNYEF